jgi:hypothetical protein
MLLAAATLAMAGLAPNMNGGYEIANAKPSGTPGSPHEQGFSTNWRNYPSPVNNPVRSFDVYSPPIRTQYGQVWWTMMKDVPLPGTRGGV